MAFPGFAHEKEFRCPACDYEWEARVRYVRCSEDDPYDMDIEPEAATKCPECGEVSEPC
jgi:hypothetical protein